MKNKIAWLVPSVIVLLVTMAGVMVYLTRSWPSAIEHKEDWKTYTSKDGVLTFSYPPDWEINHGNKQDIGPLLRDMVEVDILGQSSSGTPLSVNLVVEQAPVLAPPAEVSVKNAKSWIESLGDMSGMRYDITSFYPVQVLGMNAGIDTAKVTYLQMGVTLLNKQLIFPLLSKTYYITITSDEQSWSEAQLIFDKIVQSVKVNR